ncbi:Oxidoreductase [Coniosporium tulheliwenetii]|uniref:Oxidoreductase n=1 Tax=Coniosporium tulheliwenetii TaxID=3383036 RepID=A0ACC2YNF0_9PEZI|nr:Oxidoreductase [Cladosporium sp. JES 115]
MFRSASRTILSSPLPRYAPRAAAARRFLSTAPPHQKSRSWKSSTVRWGLAIGAVYYYNTSNVFAEEPAYAAPLPATEHETEELPTIDSLSAQRRQKSPSLKPSDAPNTSIASPPAASGALGEAGAAVGSPGELEEEADQQGAFNPETGEINWDCPCLGEEPKGMDCIDRFKGMQDCFRQHPDIYGSELDDDDDDEEPNEASAPHGEGVAATSSDAERSSPPNPPPQHERAEKVADVKPHHQPEPQHEQQQKQERAKSAAQQVSQDHAPQSESNELVPKSSHDATSSNESK